LAVLALVSCRHEERERQRSEAGRVSRAVELLREAPNSEKSPLLSALRRTECTLDRTRELKDMCVRAYQLHIDALDGVRAAQRSVRDDAASAGDVAELVVSSEKKLSQSLELQNKCALLQGALRRDLKL
jgi:hypothetical protein